MYGKTNISLRNHNKYDLVLSTFVARKLDMVVLLWNIGKDFTVAELQDIIGMSSSYVGLLQNQKELQNCVLHWKCYSLSI